MPERVIPGVNVDVVKEVVVPQLSPAGVLGILGLVEDDSLGVERAASWRRFIKAFGRGSAYSLPEARAALENGVTELVVVPVTSEVAAPAHTRLELVAADEAQRLTSAGEGLELQARARGSWANDAKIVVTHRKRAGAVVGVDLEILLPGQQSGEGEKLQNLQLLPGFTRSLGETLVGRSDLLCLDAAGSPGLRADEATVVPLTNGGPPQTLLRTAAGIPVMRLRAASPILFSMRADADGATFHLNLTHDDAARTPIPLARSSFNLRAGPLLAHGTVLQGCPDAGALFEVLDGLAEVDVECCLWPAASDRARLTGGQDASAREYIQALDALVDEPDVDLVVAGLQFATSTDAAVLDANKRKARAVYGAIISHCEVMAGESKGRLGFGHVPPGLSVEDVVELADSMVSDRFVLASPHGCAGALAGRVGSLAYFRSPTMKTLVGLPELSVRHGQEDQKALLIGRLLPVAKERGRGVIVVKGITTDGEQISVRRVADRASRGVKLIGDLFIGRLNNADGRAALRQKLSEFLYQMQRDGAIVPSTDGESPAFQLEVHSTQDDFSKGIVRVDLAVRPVRAIDFIYATLLVQV